MKSSVLSSSMWKSDSVKLAILVPARDYVYSQFSFSLAQLMKTTSLAGIDTYLFFDTSTILLNQRENLVKNAIELDSDYILWLDSDMMFPSTTVLRLLNHNKDVVACNYMKRSNPLKSVAYPTPGEWNGWLPITNNDELVEVRGVGMGCVLMKTKIFKELEQPWFEFIWQSSVKDWGGEDFKLCKKINEIGYKIWIDMNLSKDIKHIGQFAYGEKLSTNRNRVKLWDNSDNGRE
jgi:hypothetical protein